MTTHDFYRAFEERYRGPRSLIQQRLQVYLPYVQPLLSRDSTAPAPAAIDLGCGRGEWLELLQTAGFAAQGVDLDAGMLAACHQLGLPAVQGDALAHLRVLGDGTQAIVSGFHIAEHIGFDDLQALISEALRVLQPGGLLILETPNPENLTVGSCSFYLDPTHQRPLPPKLLSFLPEHLGYARVKVLRLQEESRLLGDASIQLIDVLAGVSPDYAVVAQKTASPEILQTFDAVFALAHGLELEALAQRFDSRMPPPHLQEEIITRIEAYISAQIAPLTDQMAQTEARIGSQLALLIEQLPRAEVQSSAQMASLVEHLNRAQARMEVQLSSQLSADLSAQLAPLIYQVSHTNHLREAVQARALAAEAERDALRQSFSWRIMAGPRAVVGWGMRMGTAAALSQAAGRVSQRTLVPMMRTVLKNPRLSYRINQVLMRFPALHQRLVGVARQGGVVVDLQAYGTDDLPSVPPGDSDLTALTPEARKIYRQFKAATGQAPQPSKEHT